MTPDIQELKRLAEAATAGPYKLHAVSDITVIDPNGGEVCTVGPADPIERNGLYETEYAMLEANAAYIAAASPDTLLALIEENERLRGHIGVLLDNEPDELAADGGVTVLDVWRKEAVERFRIPVLTEDRTALEGVRK